MNLDDHRIPEESDEQVPAVSLADFNEADYLALLDEIELTDPQKSEFLRIMWDIMRCFVEWNVPAESWGRIVESIINPQSDESGGVE